MKLKLRLRWSIFSYMWRSYDGVGYKNNLWDALWYATHLSWFGE